jgi:hypothetical protein
MVGHFFSAPPQSLQLDDTQGLPGEIFRTDITGDGTDGDLLPGTVPGEYMHQIKGDGLNNLINNYNTKYAGQLTPAGQALVAAGVLTQAQLVSLNAVQQKIATVPSEPLPNAALRAFDANASYPIKLAMVREGFSIVPGVAVYNVFNMSNFGTLGGVLANQTDAGGAVGTVNNYLNGPNTPLVENGIRAQRGSGTYDQFAPRSMEFSLKLNF